MHKVLITGGSGLIGSAVQHALQPAGYEFTRLVRDAADSSEVDVPWKPERPEAPISPGNMRSVEERLENCVAAVHLAGANLSGHRWTSGYKKKIRDSRIDSTRALLAILSRLRKRPSVLVCASAVGFYGDRGGEILTERSSAGTGFLAEVCQEWEAVTEEARALGVRVVHLRFGVVLAQQGGALKKLLPVFKLALGGHLGDGRQWMSWVALEDVVRTLQFAIENEQLSGVYNMVAPVPVTNREFTAALGRALHRPAPWIVPAFALRAMFGQMADETLLASCRALPERLESAGFEFRWREIESALKAIVRH